MYKWKKVPKREYLKKMGDFVYLSNSSCLEEYTIEEAMERNIVKFSVLGKTSFNNEFAFDTEENKYTEMYEKVECDD